MSKDTIYNIKQFFEDKPVIKAYLFGSFARNEQVDNSDIDILVDLDYSKKVEMEFIRMKLDLEKLLNKKVDLVSSGGLSKYIKPYIDKDKVLIYDRED